MSQVSPLKVFQMVNWKRFIPFFALSRTPHGLIDMAAPALAALLCLGHFPSPLVALVGLITVFSGYTAVYALNDLVDIRSDRERVTIDSFAEAEKQLDLDGILPRHPIAKGVLGYRAGLFWAVVWSVIAMAGAYWLNPVCLIIFFAGCAMEVLYCKLWRVTPWRTIVNGLVKTLGSVAAIFAVDPTPSPVFLTTLFLWLFFWEIGGQNIPNDWADIQEDRQLKARTIPLYFGRRKAGILSISALVGTLFLHMLVLSVSPLEFGPAWLLTALVLDLVLLFAPALRMVKTREPTMAMALFNKASYYPLSNLVLVLVRLAV